MSWVFCQAFCIDLFPSRVLLALLVLLAKMDSMVFPAPLALLVLVVALVMLVLLYVALPLCLVALQPQERLDTGNP